VIEFVGNFRLPVWHEGCNRRSYPNAVCDATKDSTKKPPKIFDNRITLVSSARFTGLSILLKGEMTMAETEKKEKIEYDEFRIDLFGDWTGSRVDRRTHVPARALAILFTLPVPTNDAEAQQMYGCDMATIVEKGVVQISYDKDSFIDDWKKDPAHADSSPEDFGVEFEKSLVSTPTKREKRSEVKAKAADMKKLEAATGLTVDQILAKLKEAGITKA